MKTNTTGKTSLETTARSTPDGELSRPRWATGILAMLIPLFLVLQSLVWFPARVVLDRDLQLNGREVPGRIVEYVLTHGKHRLEIHNFKVEYAIDHHTYRAWVTLADPHHTIGEPINLFYAPLFPRYIQTKPFVNQPWDQNLALQIAAHMFITLACGTMAFLFYRRFIGQYRSVTPDGGHKPKSDSD